MDFMALMLSVEVTRRDVLSAMPDAEVRSSVSRWQRLVARLRRPRIELEQGPGENDAAGSGGV